MLEEFIEHQSGHIITFNRHDMVFYALYTYVAGPLWEQLSMPFSDKEDAHAHKPSWPRPIGGGCTVDPVGRWDLEGQKSTAWNVLFTQDTASCCVHVICFRQYSLASTSRCLHSRLPPRHVYQQACKHCMNRAGLKKLQITEL